MQETGPQYFWGTAAGKGLTRRQVNTSPATFSELCCGAGAGRTQTFGFSHSWRKVPSHPKQAGAAGSPHFQWREPETLALSLNLSRVGEHKTRRGLFVQGLCICQVARPFRHNRSFQRQTVLDSRGLCMRPLPGLPQRETWSEKTWISCCTHRHASARNSHRLFMGSGLLHLVRGDAQAPCAARVPVSLAQLAHTCNTPERRLGGGSPGRSGAITSAKAKS